MDYTISPTNAKYATIHPESTIDDMFTILPGVLVFQFEPGNYYINYDFVISKNNVQFISTTSLAKDVHIYQKNPAKDSIVIKQCSGVKISYISIHNTSPGKVALTGASISRTNVNNCYIYGNPSTFSVYYAGPSYLTQGQPTLDAFYANNLDSKNIFTKNVVYSKWAGDSVSFSLQKNGTFSSNIIRGGKVAIYMCNTVNVTNNTIYDSSSNGMYISLPSTNINVTGNKIYECKASGIKIKNQEEHGAFTPSDYNIQLTGNLIYDAEIYAIELNDTWTATLSGNKFISTDIFGIYAYNSKNLTISNNKLSYFTTTIWLESTTDVNISGNLLFSVYPDEANNILKAVNNSTGISFTNNQIRGHVVYDLYAIDGTSSATIGTDNVVSPFYTYDEELSIMR